MPFRFIPSASYYPGHGGIGIYVKWGKTNIDHLEVVQQTSSMVWLKAPDRELLIMGDQHEHGNVRPLDANFDEFISLSPYFSATANDFEIDWYMTNYLQNIGKPAPNHCKGKHGAMWLSDSGGFQLVMERYDYIEPAGIAKWYEGNTDVGIVLDIPTVADKELLERAAKIQVRTTGIMKDNIDKVELMNVIHGYSLSDYQRFHDTVYDDSMKRICIGDAYRGDIFAAISDVTRLLPKLAKDYDQFHVLGIYNLSVLASYFWLANRMPEVKDKLITADASTHIQSAMGRLYHLQKYTNAPMERIPIGLSKKIKLPSLNRRLPCSCPVCTTLGYTDFLSVCNGALIYYMLMNHNMFVINRLMLTMDEYARTLEWDEYRELCRTMLGLRGKGEAHKALDFVNSFIADGPEKAHLGFRKYFSDSRLFSEYDYETKGLLMPDETVIAHSKKEWQGIINKVLTRYESEVLEVKQSKRLKHKKKKKVVFNSGKKKSKIKRRR